VIVVSRLNGVELFINPHLIETIEATPDTVILLTTGKRMVVKETAAEVVSRIVKYRQTINEQTFRDFDNGVS
jgi:flagellar protein FlbD